MPLIERKVLGSTQIEKTDVPITYYLDGAELSRANPIQYVDISLPDKTVVSSVQGSVASIVKPLVTGVGIGIITNNPGTPTQGDGPTYFPGLQFFNVTDWFTSTYSIIGVQAAIASYGRAYIQSILGDQFPLDMVQLNPNVYRFPDGSLHFITTVLRPIKKGVLNSLGQVAIVWYPYTLTYQVTGFELNDIGQGQEDEQVSCVVQDAVCNELYGYRPGKEEQSDFIETQKQACRVGEYILWQAQMVISVDLSVPYNPGIRRGQTMRVKNLSKQIDILGIVKDVRHLLRVGTGAEGTDNLSAITQVQVRATEYIFRSALAETDPQEVLDMRQLAA